MHAYIYIRRLRSPPQEGPGIGTSTISCGTKGESSPPTPPPYLQSCNHLCSIYAFTHEKVTYSCCLLQQSPTQYSHQRKTHSRDFFKTPETFSRGTIHPGGGQIILGYIVPRTSFPRKNCPGDKFSWGTEIPPTPVLPTGFLNS